MKFLYISLGLVFAASPALAQTAEVKAAAAQPSQVFDLGEVQVTAQNRHGEMLGGSTVSVGELQTFGKDSLNRALDLIPGTSESNTGGSRNERLVYIRGFDRFQTTLSIDGIRVYLPADNRLDFGRFVTADLSEIQVSKGYVSVLDGPGGLGGAINLVTRKPVGPLEAELRVGANLDGDGSFNGHNLSGVVGGRRGNWYFQVSGAQVDRMHWRLPSGFTPTAMENGGNRDNTAAKDWRVNLKAGWTPREGDEYSINYTRQEGSKGAPYHINDALASQRFWDWPYWDISSLYFLSNTKIGATGYFKTKAYYNTFENGLFAFDNAAQTLQTLPRAFRSYYDDYAYGGALEAGIDPAPFDTLKAAFTYRRDHHDETQDLYAVVAGTVRSFREPPQKTVEDTMSVAVENALRLGEHFDLVAGASYDWRDLKAAEEFVLATTGNFSSGSFFSYPLADGHAWNWQAAATWRFSAGTKLYASVSDRTRFPSIFERFSSRFGGAVSNPGLKPERALNVELGGGVEMAPGIRFEAAVFRSAIEDVILSVPFVFNGTAVTQSRNAGKGTYYGIELSGTAEISPTLTLGANYTALHRQINDPNNRNLRPTGTPGDKAFLYAQWRPAAAFTVTPSVEFASDRWTTNTAGTVYYRTGAYMLVGLAAAWTVTPHVELSGGVRNLLDAQYSLWDGFPEEGRSAYLTLRLKL